MSVFTNSASRSIEQAHEYTAAILDLLGAQNPMDVLPCTADAVRNATANLTEAQLSQPESPAKWSLRQVVQHLADSELVGGFRFRMVLAHESPELPGYDQDLWAQRLSYQDADIATSLQEFSMLRQMNLRLLRRATPEDMRRVMRHAERGDERLSHMIKLYAAHDLVHLKQIARIRQAIGAPAR